MAVRGIEFLCNLGSNRPLVLSISVIAQIYLGNITNWNDPRIAQLNPTTSLPSNQIILMAYRNSSQLNLILTNTLSSIDPLWDQIYGTTDSLEAASNVVLVKDNQNMNELLIANKNSLGFVELDQAKDLSRLFYINNVMIINRENYITYPDVNSLKVVTSILTEEFG